MKPAPGLKNRRDSVASIENVSADAGAGEHLLWVHTVPAEIVASVSDQEKRRQEAINEVIYTEQDFVRDMEYLRDVSVVFCMFTCAGDAKRVVGVDQRLEGRRCHSAGTEDGLLGAGVLEHPRHHCREHAPPRRA